MECDKDMAHINQKCKVELPVEWCSVFEAARKNPSPIHVINITNDSFFKITDGLKPYFRATCPIPTRPVREMKVDVEKPGLIMHRDNWNGPFQTASVLKRGRRQPQPHPEQVIAFKRAHTAPLPISRPKYNDLQVLKMFCSVEVQAYFDRLPVADNVKDSLHDTLPDESE